MFLVRVICLCLCVFLMIYAFLHLRYVESYNEVKTIQADDDLKQKIKAFFEPTELYGKHILADNEVISYEKIFKGMSKEASDQARSVTGDATNRAKESIDNAQLVRQTSIGVDIQSRSMQVNGPSE